MITVREFSVRVVEELLRAEDECLDCLINGK